MEEAYWTTTMYTTKSSNARPVTSKSMADKKLECNFVFNGAKWGNSLARILDKVVSICHDNHQQNAALMYE